MKKVRPSPKLKHEHTCHKLTPIFPHRNKHQKVNCCQEQKINNKKSTGKKMKEIKCTENKKGKENLRLPRSHGCPTNPFHHSLKFDIPLVESVTFLHYKKIVVLSRFFKALLSPKNGSKTFEPFFFSRFTNGSTPQVLKTKIDLFLHKTVQTWAAFIKAVQTGLRRFKKAAQNS